MDDSSQEMLLWGHHQHYRDDLVGEDDDDRDVDGHVNDDVNRNVNENRPTPPFLWRLIITLISSLLSVITMLLLFIQNRSSTSSSSNGGSAAAILPPCTQQQQQQHKKTKQQQRWMTRIVVGFILFEARCKHHHLIRCVLEAVLGTILVTASLCGLRLLVSQVQSKQYSDCVDYRIDFDYVLAELVENDSIRKRDSLLDRLKDMTVDAYQHVGSKSTNNDGTRCLFRKFYRRLQEPQTLAASLECQEKIYQDTRNACLRQPHNQHLTAYLQTLTNALDEARQKLA